MFYSEIGMYVNYENEWSAKQNRREILTEGKEVYSAKSCSAL